MRKLPSLTLITQKLALAAKRFPISIMLIMCLTVSLFAEDIGWLGEYTLEGIFRLKIFLSIGALISVATVLWLEDFASYAKQQIITFFITLLWGTYCLFFLIDISNQKTLEFYVIGLAIFLAILFASFLKKDKDKAFWNFSVNVTFQLGLALCFGTITFIGLAIANSAMETLFNVSALYWYLLIICIALFAPVFFLANIPDKTVKHSEKIALNKYLKILALYILLPLAAIYAVILYAYLFKIIFTWELPKGSVSYLVSVLALSGLLIITLIYPIRLEAKNKFIASLHHYFSLIILPLLILMTVGILRRINDYGITISRCYVFLLNIWFYGIYAYLFIVKAKRIKWISISFAIIALLASVGFWNVSSFTKRTLIADLYKHLDGKKIFLNQEDQDTFFEKTKREDERKIRSKMEYLYDFYNKESIYPFFSDSVSRIYYLFAVDIDGLPMNELQMKEKKEEIEKSFDHRVSWRLWPNETQDIEHFNTYVHIYYLDRDNKNERKTYCYYKDKQLIIKFIPDNRTFSIPLHEDILNNSSSKEDMEKNTFKYNDYMVLIDGIAGHYDKAIDSVYIESCKGYLFYNK
jgi:hypothetical protein